MQRAAVLWRASPARVVLALFALMLAAAMAVGSGANFNSTSANLGNTVTAGILKHTNSKEGLAILNQNTVAISNDNDFSLGLPAPVSSKLWVIRLSESLN